MSIRRYLDLRVIVFSISALGFHYGCKDWINFENRCVHFSIDGLDWNQARQFCRNKQGDLVTVKNQLEFDRFKMFGNGAWIGLNAIRDPGGPRVFEWSNGAEMTYTPWDVESPTGSVNGNGTINCGGMTSRVRLIALGGCYNNTRFPVSMVLINYDCNRAYPRPFLL